MPFVVLRFGITSLVAVPGMTGATMNIHCSLHEAAGIAFVLNLLRPADQCMGFPQNHGQVNRRHAMTLRLSTDDQSNQDKAPVHGAAEAGSD
jgi:hypothetical protein